MIYDLIVIGGGPAGYLASERAGEKGMKVLCIEKANLGGVCLNEGCVPTKTLLYSAKLLDGVNHGEKYGVTAENAKIDHAKVVARKNKVVKMLVSGIKSSLKAKNAETVTGEAKIKCKTENGFSVSVGETDYEAKKLLIATGSSAFVPPVKGAKEGMEKGTILTNREILALTEVPEKLVVVGGGVIGLEMASYFNSIGSEVTVIEMLDHIAGENDADMGLILKKNYEKKGVKFLLSTKVVEFTDSVVKCENESGEIEVPFTHVLMSVGRRANTAGLGLEELGVELNRGAIVTNEKMETSVEGIFAAGDCNGKSMLAHTAYREAEVAINNMTGTSDTMEYTKVPSVIYTNPELGSVGETEATATKKGLDFESVTLNMRYSGRYMAENEGGDGIFKLLVDKNSKTVIGAQALCNYASEFIVSVGVMMEAKMTVDQIKKVIFPHPTVCEIIREGIFSLGE